MSFLLNSYTYNRKPWTDYCADFSLIPCRYLMGGKNVDFTEVITSDTVSKEDSIQYEKHEKPSFVARNLTFCLLSSLIVVPATLLGLVLKVITLIFNRGFRKTQFESAKQIQSEEKKVNKVIVIFGPYHTSSDVPRIMERLANRYPTNTPIEDFSQRPVEALASAQGADVIMGRIEDNGGCSFFGGDGALPGFEHLYDAKLKEGKIRLLMMVNPEGSCFENIRKKVEGWYPEVEYIVTR